MRTVSFKADLDLIELLDWYAMNHRIQRSLAIRMAIERMVKEEMSKQTVPVARVEKIGDAK